MRTAIISFFTQSTLLLACQVARADWLPVLSGPVTRVVAAGNYVAALRKGEVLILRADGGLVSRIAEKKPIVLELEGLDASRVAEATLDRLEIPEIDRGTDYTDDLVDDETRLGLRRAWRLPRRPMPALPSAPVLAASSTEIWIGDDRGIHRVTPDGDLAQRFGRAWLGRHMAAAEHRIVVDLGTALALLSMDNPEPHVVQVSTPIRHLTISPSGRRLAWASDTSISILGPAGTTSFEPTSGVTNLAFCGETLAALLATGLVAIPPEGRADMRAAPTESRRLYCPTGPSMPWLSLGQRLWVSSDQGETWSSVAVPGGAEPHDVAVSDRHVWLATSEGLFASVDGNVTADMHAGTPSRSRSSDRPPSSWLAWLLPKVSLRAAAEFSPGGHQVEGFAFAAFPLGKEPLLTKVMALPEDGPREPPVEPTHQGLALEPRDADASCLGVARRKAIELAMTEPERARSYVRRAGHAAWLPELRILVSRRYGRSESLDVNSSSTALSSPLGIDTVNDIRYEARATWDLGKLVFSSDELAAQAQALHMAELRRDIETTVNRLYFERRRLRVAPAPQRADTAVSMLRSQEIDADLDALSAGAFGACVSEKQAGAR